MQQDSLQQKGDISGMCIQLDYIVYRVILLKYAKSLILDVNTSQQTLQYIFKYVS